MNDGAKCQSERMGQVKEQLNLINDVKKELSDTMERLKNRISLIVVPFPSNVKEKEELIQLCPLAEELRGILDYLRNYKSELNSLINSVEL